LKPEPEHGIDGLLRLIFDFMNVGRYFEGRLPIALDLCGLLIVFLLHLLATGDCIKVNYLLRYVDVLLDSLLRCRCL
jgi:hypothetical protein